MPGRHYPVAIIGAGPTGLMLANLLGVYGVETLLVERHAATVGEPRAVSIDDESLRAVQNAGALDRVLPDVVQGYGVMYHDFAGREFARIMPPSREYGHAKRNAFRQPMFEAALCAALARFAHVHVRMGHELTGFTEACGKVELTLRHASGASQATCDWLIACDGGHSTVRDQLGIAMRGATYAERWLIVDLKDREDAFIHTRTYCDPARPAIRLPGPHGTLRYEFMLRPGENADALLEETRVRGWIRQREAADAALPIVRKTVYTFHARMAETWRKGRVFLAGDAAHLTPPFAGQGMNSGVRDVFSLAWKLAAVVHCGLGPRLLDSYAVERPPHAGALIRMALCIGAFMQPKSRWSARLMQGALRATGLYPPARDYILHLKFKPKPRFDAGFFVPDAAPNDAMRAGQLFVQPQVETPDGTRVLLDDMLGKGFACIAWSTAPDEPALDTALADLHANKLVILRQQQPFPDIAPPHEHTRLARDCDGVLETVLDGMHAHALLLRPDRHVLAVLRAGHVKGDLARVTALLAQTWES